MAVLIAFLTSGVAFVMLSSILILSSLEIPINTDSPNRTDTPTQKFTYPPECIDEDGITCIQEVKHLDRQMMENLTCFDFHKAVCNDNYFLSAEWSDSSMWPYRYSSLEYMYETIENFIEEHLGSGSKTSSSLLNDTGLLRTLLFIKNCSSGDIKRALSSVGLPSIPYSYLDNHILPDVSEVLARVTHSLDLQIFFAVDFVPKNVTEHAPFGRQIMLRKVSHSGEVTERRRKSASTEKDEFIYSLMKTRHLLPSDRRLYHYIGSEFHRLAGTMAAETINKTSMVKIQSVKLRDLPGSQPLLYPNGSVQAKPLNWTLFFETLLPSTTFKFQSDTEVLVRGYDALSRIVTIIQTTPPHVILNYILLAAWSHITPILPEKYFHHLSLLPGLDYTAISGNRYLPACIKLAESFCPDGMIAVIKYIFLGYNDADKGPNMRMSSFADFYKDALTSFFEYGTVYFMDATNQTVNNYKQAIKTKYIDKYAPSFGIPRDLLGKTIEDLKCSTFIDNVGAMEEAMNLTLFRYVSVVKKSNKEVWNSRFFMDKPKVRIPMKSNFMFKVTFTEDEMFVPLSYLGLPLKYPLLWEVYVWMSLPDVFSNFMTFLFELDFVDSQNNAIPGGQILALTETLSNCLRQELASSLSIRDRPLLPGEMWFHSNILSSKYMFQILNNDKIEGLIKTRLNKGFKKMDNEKLMLILFGESLCRRYMETDISWETLFHYGIPPKQALGSDAADATSASSGLPASLPSTRARAVQALFRATRSCL